MGGYEAATEHRRVVPSPAPAEALPWLAAAATLLAKDVRSELRTRTAVSAVGVFAFASLLLLALSTASLKDLTVANPFTGAVHPAWDSAGKMGLLWVLLCFAAFAGLAHTFVHEEETGTVTALRLSMPAEAVYAGKLAFNLLLLIAVAAAVTPVYMLLTGMIAGPPIVFLCVMLSGAIGLAAAATIVGALAAKARGTGALFGAIGLPLLIVLLILLMNAAGTLYRAASPVQIGRDVGGLLSYGVLMIAVSAITFHFVWED
jgi:heme exporter protein B